MSFRESLGKREAFRPPALPQIVLGGDGRGPMLRLGVGMVYRGPSYEEVKSLMWWHTLSTIPVSRSMTVSFVFYSTAPLSPCSLHSCTSFASSNVSPECNMLISDVTGANRSGTSSLSDPDVFVCTLVVGSTSWMCVLLRGWRSVTIHGCWLASSVCHSTMPVKGNKSTKAE